MKIICPNCHSSYHLDGRKVPETRFKAKCPKCEHKFIIDPEEILNGAGVKPPDVEPEPTPASLDYDDSVKHQENESEAPINDDDSAPEETYAVDQEEELPKEPPCEDIDTVYPALADINQHSFAIEAIFSPNKKGRLKNRLNDHKLKIILAVQEILQKMLDDDEKVMKVGRGSACYPQEIPYANGIFTLPYNYFAIICTNKRLLFINIDPLTRRATGYKYQMLYEGIKQVKRGIFLSSLIICRNRGKCRNFTTVKRSIAKEIQAFIEQKIDESEAIKYASEIAENICPDCLQPIHGQLEQCPHCRVEFKDAKIAMLKSLALPGWGALYLGHTGLGILEAGGTIMSWAIIISLCLSDVPWNIAISLLLLLTYNGTDSLLTYFLGRKGCLVT